MSITKTLGGDRLGSGNKMKVAMNGYERSTHDLSYVWRSTMASGTLVPFLTEVGLPGDTFDISLQTLFHTHPTIGPLFGIYKIQLDVFQIPMRLYNAKLHMNMLHIGLDMSQIKIPQLRVVGRKLDPRKNMDNQQINPSCILSYLNIRGLGNHEDPAVHYVPRTFNAIPFLSYWDIYKNYYANKSEEIGICIATNLDKVPTTIVNANIYNSTPDIIIPTTLVDPIVYTYTVMDINSYITINCANLDDTFDVKNLIFYLKVGDNEFQQTGDILFEDWNINGNTNQLTGSFHTQVYPSNIGFGYVTIINETGENDDVQPELLPFALDNIDQMRKDILADINNTDAFQITNTSLPPYNIPLDYRENAGATNLDRIGALHNQQGLGIKTYQSDLFNNWIDTEWIDGVDGISAITAVDTSNGSFTIDELNLSRKIYNMLNRIAVSGGSYDDWLEVTYDHIKYRSCENPMYMGGLIQDLVFDEVVSNSFAQANGYQQPLGSLAGRGTKGNKNKGGNIVIKIDEPSYIMGIISLTPYVDYSQGNKWDTNLRTMNDFHKPALDQIGFQDLITDQLAWFDTVIDPLTGNPTYKSAGKQPAWLNYMTNVNQVRGNFATESDQMFMVLNRRYEPNWSGNNVTIKDLTTYIDPSKFNHIFANTRRDAQNFWAQIGVNMIARRKMSAKLIPNL